MHDQIHDHPHGLTHDLETLMRQAQHRRAALRWLGAGAAAALAGCGGGGGSSGTDTATTTSTSSGTGSSSTGTSTTTTTTTTGTTSGTAAAQTCSAIPSETAGPYPGDGTNNGGNGGIANALSQSGIVRSDIVSSFGSSTGKADGVALTVRLQLVNIANNCASLEGLAVYLWHCDQQGRYSMYSQAIAGENYLRGLQVSDSSGVVTFTTIVPGCYAGRWPHIHFEVFPSLSVATSGANDVKTSQLALPATMCSAVYADSRYSGSSANLAQTSLASDNVFSDGATLETPSVAGSNAAGYVATLVVGVSA